MAVLSAFFVIETVRRTGLSERTAGLLRKSGHLPRLVLLPLFFLTTALGGFLDVSKIWSQVLAGEEGRPKFLAQKFGGYELLNSLTESRIGTVYQLGFEGELYYLGKDVRGEWFGPGRYADVMSLSLHAPELAQHLADIGADSLLINREREPFSNQVWAPAFLEYFELTGQTERAALYGIKSPVKFASDQLLE